MQCSINQSAVKETVMQSANSVQTNTKRKKKKTEQLVSSTERKIPGVNWERYKSLFSETNKNNKRNFSQHRHLMSNRMYNSSDTDAKEPKIKRLEERLEVKSKHDIKNKEKKLTKQVAIDCEMVGIGDGGIQSMIARVSIVNKYGDCIYDKYVKPVEDVVDYRTAVSGIRPEHLQDGEEFSIVQKEVADILKGRILVGHALKHDLNVLYLSHPRTCWRDTSRYKPFQVSKGRTPSLKRLALEFLGIKIQVGEHNSVEDARTAMQLYMLYKNKWEARKKPGC